DLPERSCGLPFNNCSFPETLPACSNGRRWRGAAERVQYCLGLAPEPRQFAAGTWSTKKMLQFRQQLFQRLKLRRVRPDRLQVGDQLGQLQGQVGQGRQTLG